MSNGSSIRGDRLYPSRAARDDSVPDRTGDLVDDNGDDDDDDEGDSDSLPVAHVEDSTQERADSASTDHSEDRARADIHFEAVEPERDDLGRHLRPNAPAQHLQRARAARPERFNGTTIDAFDRFARELAQGADRADSDREGSREGAEAEDGHHDDDR